MMCYSISKEAIINYVKLVRVTRAPEALEPEKQIKVTLGYAIGTTVELVKTTGNTHTAFKEAAKEAINVICSIGEVMPLPVKDILDVAYAVYINRYNTAYNLMSEGSIFSAANMMTGRSGVNDGGNITEMVTFAVKLDHSDKGMVVSAINAVQGIIEATPTPVEGA